MPQAQMRTGLRESRLRAQDQGLLPVHAGLKCVLPALCVQADGGQSQLLSVLEKRMKFGGIRNLVFVWGGFIFIRGFRGLRCRRCFSRIF